MQRIACATRPYHPSPAKSTVSARRSYSAYLGWAGGWGRYQWGGVTRIRTVKSQQFTIRGPLIKSLDKLRTNGRPLIPFVLSPSSHTQIRLNQVFRRVKHEVEGTARRRKRRIIIVSSDYPLARQASGNGHMRRNTTPDPAANIAPSGRIENSRSLSADLVQGRSPPSAPCFRRQRHCICKR
jgi:hypothetical protein